MANQQISSKRVSIDKDQARIVIAVAIAAAVTSFGLVTARVLMNKLGHQNEVIVAKEEAKEQLDKNIAALDQLEAQYITFDTAPENVLGGSDESNSKIVLDSLPSKYDKAGLNTSIENLLSKDAYEIKLIDGQDKELEVDQTSSSPIPIDMIVDIEVLTTYADAEILIADLQRSIRPFSIEEIKLKGESGEEITVSIKLKTYYQAEVDLDIGSKIIGDKSANKAQVTDESGGSSSSEGDI